MKNESHPSEDIKVIKNIMEQSARFLSLSGLSGISAGLIAIAGALVAKLILGGLVLNAQDHGSSIVLTGDTRTTIMLLIINASAVLILALSSAIYFSWRKARKGGFRIWTPVTGRLLLNLAVPLLAGGFFIILTLGKLDGSVVAASTLIFYGLALVNAAKFTLGEIFWLGILEITTGLFCLALPGFAFAFWVFGFGILHIAYGTFMFLKYKG